MDWTTLGVSVITAAAAIGATVVAQRGQRAQAREQAAAGVSRERHARDLEAIAELYAACSELEGVTNGAIASGTLRLAPGTEAKLQPAWSRVQLLVSDETWAGMSPYVAAVTDRHTAFLVGVDQRVQTAVRERMLSESGDLSFQNVNKYRDTFIGAARAHLDAVRT